MKAWGRNALAFGVASAVVTIVVNWLGSLTATGTACHKNTPWPLVGFLVFLILMALAGFRTVRAGDTVGMATVAGLVAALISAIGTVVGFLILFSTIKAACITNNTSGISSSTLIAAGSIVGAILTSLIGLGIGAGMGAIGGVIGRRQAPAAA